MLEKPGELVLFRKVEDGGLGLHNIKCKALASLIATFLQSAANPRFQQSLYHHCLYRYYCLGDNSLPKPDMPPYYNQEFFNTIRKVVDETPLNPVHMSIKQWYDYLLEVYVTMEVVDDEGRQMARKSRVEELLPDNSWQRSYYFSRLRGLSMDVRSFNFKLLHQILPFKERLSYILRNTQPNCQLCDQNCPETPMHGLFLCSKNNQAADTLLTLARPYDDSITGEKVLVFNINTSDQIYELPTMLMLATGLFYIWQNRLRKKSTSPYQIRSEMESLVSLLRRTRSRVSREAGNIISNTNENFLI